eukprot:TRINITY_DN12553_c0_g2_i6.p1 TRINITY_DN12553_c0_g2~~TRINITY_DN12553_c0_g2_i6.p1  ORF type:complete len:232 (+),score=78.17 TRINITY_DN12553_c0_g2_i6:160-855(+)
MKKGGKSSRPVGVAKSARVARAELQDLGQSAQKLLYTTITAPPLYPPLEIAAKRFVIKKHTQELLDAQAKIDKNKRSSLYHIILNSLKHQDADSLGQGKNFRASTMEKISKSLSMAKGHLLPEEVERYAECREVRKKRKLEKIEKEKELRKKRVEEAQLNHKQHPHEGSIQEENKEESKEERLVKVKKEAAVKEEPSEEESLGDNQFDSDEMEGEELHPEEPRIDSPESDD